MKRQWTKAEAWDWYEKQPWIRGWCGRPQICVNWLSQWQEYRHEEVFRQIEREFGLAKKTGFNAVRTLVQFDCWRLQHDSFMRYLDEYFTLAAGAGLKVMLTLGNDCMPPKEFYEPPVFGEQHVDWGCHGGVRRGPHAAGYTEPGYSLLDEPEYLPRYYEMVDELAAKYAQDPRLQIWEVWNEPGNGRRGDRSLEPMRRFFEILRSHDPIQPLTADVYTYNEQRLPKLPIQEAACELSDVITFHCYRPYAETVLVVESLKRRYDRPLICSEWLNRIKKNDVAELFPLFYLERIGSYHWGLIAGYSQTYEPYERYYAAYLKEGSDLDMTRWQHDLFRFNGLPYDPAEVRCIERFCRLADERDGVRKQNGTYDNAEFRGKAEASAFHDTETGGNGL